MREPKAFRRVELEPGQRQTVTVAEWMADDENFAAKVRHATRKIGIDFDSDPTVAAFVLNMPAYKMLQMSPIMPPEKLDEILSEGSEDRVLVGFSRSANTLGILHRLRSYVAGSI